MLSQLPLPQLPTPSLNPLGTLTLPLSLHHNPIRPPWAQLAHIGPPLFSPFEAGVQSLEHHYQSSGLLRAGPKSSIFLQLLCLGLQPWACDIVWEGGRLLALL